jgi:hypothetical protein
MLGDTKDTPPEPPGSFQPPRVIDSLGDERPWTQWDSESDHTAGISGMYVISDDTMVVDNRGMNHHNGQLRNLLERVYDRDDPGFDNIMAWGFGVRKDWSDDAPDGAKTADLELPRSAGGLTQAYRRLGLDGDARAVQHGMDVSADVLWPVVWTCKLLDCPEETAVRFSHANDRYASPDPGADGMTVTYSGNRRQMATAVDRVFPLRLAYQELSFLGELPETRVTRDIAVREQ